MTANSRVAWVLLGSVLFGVFLAALAFFVPRGSQVEASNFSSRRAVLGSRSYLRVLDSPALDPQSGNDLLIVAWFRLGKLPKKKGEKLLLFSKYNTDDPARSGYALALTREPGQIRPLVYWKDPAGRGGWYSFSEIELEESKWFFVALSFYSGRYLGLHTFSEGADGQGKLQLAGGFDLEEELYPKSRANLIIGSIEGALDSRGSVAGFCILKPANLKNELETLIGKISLNVVESIARIDKDQMLFCSSDLENDLSPFSHQIERISAQGRK